MKDSYDVIVVGGGPAGSSTAEECAKLGLDVLVLERNPQIGEPKRCGEGLSHNSVLRLGLDIPADCIAQDIDGAVVYAPNGKEILVEFKEAQGHILHRKKFDKWLASNAERAGAEIIRNALVYDLIKEDGFVTGVRAKMDKDYEIKSKVVVAADGAESLIARKSGLKTNKALNLVDSGFQYEMSGIEMKYPSKINLFVGTTIAPRGYVWIFPKGKTANVGIGILPSENTAKSYLDKFIESNEGLKKGSIVEVNGGCVPVGGLMENMVADGLVGVGDVVNQVNALHGGGMAEAITAGRMAGKVIKKAIDSGDVSAKALDEYNKVWWKERGNHLAKVVKVREAFEKMTDKNMNNLADSLSGEDLVDLARGKNLLKLSKILLKYEMKNLSDLIRF